MGEVEGFAKALASVRVIGLDSMAFIYHLEGSREYGVLTRVLFARIEGGELSACTSVLSVAEVLTGALKAGDELLAQLYRQLFDLMPNLAVRPIDADCAPLAARLRAESGLRTPDALQIAAAIQGGAEAFLTNDARLRPVPQLRVLLLSDYA